jgi:hypothetical protein
MGEIDLPSVNDEIEALLLHSKHYQDEAFVLQVNARHGNCGKGNYVERQLTDGAKLIVDEECVNLSAKSERMMDSSNF